ncbi:MAG: GNAT family N-acetyltransferase [Saprospiraceae bacterium]|nr:GNAT family N-acetyltransferase [Pyrinomonadaceae bacterium]
MKILETERLILRLVKERDAEFVLDLLNQPSFIEFIGDRGVRTLEEARNYIQTRFTKSYEDNGHSLYLVELKESSTPIGLCGFVKRDTLPDPDIGFAFLPQFGGKGYAVEAARGVMEYGRDVLKFERVLAITTQNNESSGRLLDKIGFEFERLIEMPPDNEILKLFLAEPL